MKFTIFALLLTTATASASTHVNISFTQQHSSTGSTADAAYLRNKPAELNGVDSIEQLSTDDKNSRLARIKIDDKKSQIDVNSNQKVVSDVKPNHELTGHYRSERVQKEERDGYFGSVPQNQQRTFYNANHEVHQNYGQFRNLSPQEKKNMEFERYIQSYHSGPTVETVYESAKPEMQHTLATSSVHDAPQRIVKFERQVVLPTKPDNIQSSADVVKPIANHQSVAHTATANLGSTSSSSASPSSSLLPSKPSVSVSSSSGNSFGKDGFNFDLSYNKPNYNDPTFKYKDGHSDTFYNQFPPSVEEPHSGYGDYYSNVYNRQQIADSFMPVEQRPVVTKTIQIAQPAIKAKKYEVRHPAIQKQFYDIEERVVIKPAGTVVVELERPSAKILKEETTLPLGHPHPAVAAAYTPNRNTQTFSNIIYSNAGSSSSNRPNNQYIPQQTYNNKNVPDHHSVSTASTYDQSSKEVIAEANQNKPYVGENHFSAAPAADQIPKTQNREIVVLTDSHGNQRQISTDQFAYSRQESGKSPSRSAYNNGNSFAYEDKGRSTNQANIAPQRSGFQQNDNREELDFGAEYINTPGNTNLRNENKPARLQEASSDRTAEQKQQQQHFIKHEHKIVLPPSQHNIYLSRNQEVPTMKFIEETAEVREIKPYVQNHRGPVVVYAQAKQMPQLKYVQRPEYKSPVGVSSQVMQYHSSSQRNQLRDADNRVQYNAPYAQMRLHPNKERDMTAEQRQSDQHSERKSERLIEESVEKKTVATVKNSAEKQTPQAHIEINIPDRLSNDGNKAIFVGSTIRPTMMDNGDDQKHHSKLEISVTSNGDPQPEQTSRDEVDKSDRAAIENGKEKENLSNNDSEYVSNIKANSDCDQSSKTVMVNNYELAPEQSNSRQQKFMRIVESSNTASASTGKDVVSSADSAAVAAAAAAQTNIQPHNVDVHAKSTAGHTNSPGSRILASTAAPKESTPSESFHKRRIVVNHPFQTVREVVEHEPYTNYHEVQVNEPATPAIYHSANYYQPHGALRQSENVHSTSSTYYQIMKSSLMVFAFLVISKSVCNGQFFYHQQLAPASQPYAHPSVVENSVRESQLPPELLKSARFYKNPRIAAALAKESWFTDKEMPVVDREAEKIPRQMVHKLFKNAGWINRR